MSVYCGLCLHGNYVCMMRKSRVVIGSPITYSTCNPTVITLEDQCCTPNPASSALGELSCQGKQAVLSNEHAGGCVIVHHGRLYLVLESTFAPATDRIAHRIVFPYLLRFVPTRHHCCLWQSSYARNGKSCDLCEPDCQVHMSEGAVPFRKQNYTTAAAQYVVLFTAEKRKLS